MSRSTSRARFALERIRLQENLRERMARPESLRDLSIPPDSPRPRPFSDLRPLLIDEGVDDEEDDDEEHEDNESLYSGCSEYHEEKRDEPRVCPLETIVVEENSAVEWLERFKCPICLSLLTNPVCYNPCGHEFCDDCVRSVRRLRCPLCRAGSRGSPIPALRARSTLSELPIRVYCDNRFQLDETTKEWIERSDPETRCTQEFMLNHRKEHLRNCQYKLIKCTREYCGVYYVQAMETIHLNETCSNFELQVRLYIRNKERNSLAVHTGRIRVHPCLSVQQLKGKVWEMNEIALTDLRMEYARGDLLMNVHFSELQPTSRELCGRQLDNERLLSDYGIRKFNVVHVVLLPKARHRTAEAANLERDSVERLTLPPPPPLRSVQL